MPTNGPVLERFCLGRTLATPGALAVFKENYGERGPVMVREFLHRHQCGDWGDVCPSDARANDRSVKENTRILSAYHLPDDTKVWVITEWDRSYTTLLLPEEY